MAEYKAKGSFKSFENKHFGLHKIKVLESGGSIEITNIDDLPEELLNHLEALGNETKKKTKKVSKPDTKKKKEGDK